MVIIKIIIFYLLSLMKLLKELLQLNMNSLQIKF